MLAIKLDAATGARQYSNLFGGENLDEGNGIAVGSNGTVYITGQVSDEFSRSDVLVMALDGRQNSLLSMAHFGRERGDDAGTAIALDADNNLYLTGWTEAAGLDTDFPLVNPIQGQCGVGDSFGDCGQDAFISERTAERHVANIMNKLGFNSRAQIAAWVVEKGLSHSPPL